MASGGSNVVVWSWFNDFGQWQAFDPAVSNYIEQQKSNHGNVYLRNVEPSLAAFFIDTTAMIQTSVNSGNIRPVQRCLFPRTVPAARGIVWQWSGDAPGHWHAYDMRSQQILEAAAMQNQTNVDLSQPPINMPYAIDLRRMIQVRTNTGNTRSVRRLTTTPYAPDSGQPAMAKQQSAPPTLAAATAATNFGARTRSQTRRAASMGMGPTSTPMTVQPGPVLGSVFGAVPVLAHTKSAPSTSSGLRRSCSGGREIQMGVVELVPDAGGTNADDVFAEFAEAASTQGMTEECPICLDELSEQPEALKLLKCKHCFHKTCLTTLYNSGPKSGSLQCPICKTMYGFKHGNCPAGRMTYHIIPEALQGYDDCDTIRVIYEIPGGIQGPEHPEPGAAYVPVGFPRIGFLPNNDRGREVLSLLITAWKRRLIFTVGTSVTTGRANSVVWNEIHHKTELHGNRSGHGYPDPAYLDNVIAELAAQGVTKDT